jgi:hypothetical protein
MYNPVREIILRKLGEIRVDIVNGTDGEKVEARTNLEALVSVIFDRAIETRGRVPIEAARLMFEYAVGKPNQITEEVEPMRNVSRTGLSEEEVRLEEEEALRELGLMGSKFLVEVIDERIEGREVACRACDGDAVFEAGRNVTAEVGAGDDREESEERCEDTRKDREALGEGGRSGEEAKARGSGDSVDIEAFLADEEETF